jgi:hypothetical protein
MSAHALPLVSHLPIPAALLVLSSVAMMMCVAGVACGPSGLLVDARIRPRLAPGRRRAPGVLVLLQQ